MKRIYLVSYWICDDTKPKNHFVTIDDSHVSDLEIPIVLKQKLAEYETFREANYQSTDIILLNFWMVL